MGWPVVLSDPIPLWRNDRWQRTWPFYAAPPLWQASHAYVLGVVGGDYLADSTCRVANTDPDVEGQWIYYTCIEAHTSGPSFDATKWEADPDAKGAPIDLSAYGDSVAGQIRKAQDDSPITALDLSLTDLGAGLITAKFSAQMWTDLDSSGEVSVGFDIEIRDSGGALPLTVLAGKFAVKKDWTHA